MFAQTVAIDEDMAAIGDYLAQLNSDDQLMLTYNMAQTLDEESRD